MDENPPTLAEIARSVIFYILFYGFTVALLLVMIVVLWLAPRGVPAMVQAWTMVHRALVRHVLGIKVEVVGTPPQEGVFYALRHESFFEAIDLPQVLHRPCIFAKIELMRIPVWGRAGWAYGLIGVEREAGAKTLRTMLSHARARLAEGRPLVIFPEGTRVPVGQRVPLQSGFAGLYKLLSLPVVPVAVHSGALYHRVWKRRGTIRYVIGETIPAGLPRDEIEARVLDAITAPTP
ncbi:lysophospholipid acyltransferase family protein [Novosphingobium sp. SG720]|uniref:lysophospholipid acyltransferase family protein n=1 Tax=Novosphingobium TaxID=165696 RepID=UPI0017D7E399|nr:1-acyl-sn-glycerol-3-phosphate acyltransferase [Novosphingobium sp. SG720]